VPEYFPKQTIDRLLQLTNRGRSYAEKLVTYHDHVVGKVELSEGDERTLFGELEHVKLVYDPQRGYGDIRRGPFTYAARLLIAMVELEHTTRSTTIKESDAVKYAQWMEPRQFSKRPLGQYDNYSYGIEDLIRFRYINKVGEQPLGAPTAETTDHLTQLYPRSKEGCVMNLRPWNATKGTIDVRPDCRAWLFDCSHVALQYRQGGHWYAGTVDKQLHKILLCHTQDIPEHELGVPYHMVEVSYREFLDLGGEK